MVLVLLKWWGQILAEREPLADQFGAEWMGHWGSCNSQEKKVSKIERQRWASNQDDTFYCHQLSILLLTSWHGFAFFPFPVPSAFPYIRVYTHLTSHSQNSWVSLSWKLADAHSESQLTFRSNSLSHRQQLVEKMRYPHWNVIRLSEYKKNRMALLIPPKVRNLSYLLTQKAFINLKLDGLTLEAAGVHLRTGFFCLLWLPISQISLHIWMTLLNLPNVEVSFCNKKVKKWGPRMTVPVWLCVFMFCSGRPMSGSADRIQKLRKEYYQARREGFTVYEDDEGRARPSDYDLHWVSSCLLPITEFFFTEVFRAKEHGQGCSIYIKLYSGDANHSHPLPQKSFT